MHHRVLRRLDHLQAIKSATQDSPQGVSIGLQSVALVLMIVAVVLIVRKKK